MRKIMYINSLGAELELANAAPFVLQSFDTSNNVNIYNTKGVNQDGLTYLSNTLDIRDISITIIVMANNAKEAINYRKLINTVFNPKNGEGYLVCTDDVKERKIKCIVNKIPYFDKDNYMSLQTCLISLSAHNPFWLDNYVTGEELAIWLGGITFPLKFPANFAKRTATKKNIINLGDVETPVTIKFKGPAVNPKITNYSTGEYIQVNRTLSNSEILVINTEYGHKKITIVDTAGIESNAMHCIDLSSTFFQLGVGDNVLEYNNSNNGLIPEGVLITYSNRYIGI